MDLGFETIGNATLICHDRGPVLVTDPWIEGPAYFGSWTFSHEIPEEQRDSIRGCRFVWVSHGHPDHLSAKSIRTLKDKKILLPDHVGSRVCDSLKERGYDVQILRNRVWTSLSERIRVLSIADYNQDGILLVDIGGKLVVNLNDAGDLGWGRFVRGIIRRYEVSFLLKLSGYGDADMIHRFNENGEFNSPVAAKRYPVGRQIAKRAEQFGVRYFIPFSSMHQYQRADSIWASEYSTPLQDYAKGFVSKSSELLPAFVRYDCANDRLERIDPAPRERNVIPPEKFGDNWSDPLNLEDKKKITAYFQAIEHLRGHFDFIRVRVGGTEHTVDIRGDKTGHGITFEAPRHSLMTAIENEIFDDMLIGNFMKTTFHGTCSLYPDFSPYVAKYADNGRAKTEEELEAYFAAYRRRAPLDYFFHRLEKVPVDMFVAFVPSHSSVYRVAKRAYHRIKDM